jgi:pyruvate carboxylase
VSRTIILRDATGRQHATTSEERSVSVDGGPPIGTVAGQAGEVRVGDPARLAWTATAGDTRWVFLDGEVFEFEVQAGGRRRRGAGHQGSLAAPMPAAVLRIEAAPGDAVRRGDTLVILEAMKMELPVRAPADGTVKAVHCKPGDLVQAGVPLIEVE